MSKKISRIINVSYRLPFSIISNDGIISTKNSDGGLVAALKSVNSTELTDQKTVWLGCADFPIQYWLDQESKLNNDFEYVPVFLQKQLNNDFYNGFSNSVLWPLFHYFPSYVDFQDKYYQAYVKANELVCEKLLEILRPTDVIWIHDYHFLLLPNLIRKAQPSTSIGFFLHIPFPSFELFNILPKYSKRQLLQGLLGADLIGFHTNSYNTHFLQTVQVNLGKEHTNWKIRNKNRVLKSDVFPLGIDFLKFNTAFDNESVIVQRETLKKAYNNCKIIFSVDRLDYTKGVMNRIQALELFFEKHPHYREKVIFILVVVPSRNEVQKYWERKEMIEQAVGKINGKYGSLTWMPVVFKYDSLSFDHLIGLYTACNVMLVTPRRDGMNLVAKEFVASRTDKQGVLILSEMAGAAKELTDAILINPTDVNEIADSIKIALEMSSKEQASRIDNMQKRIADYNVNRWSNNFIQALNTIKEEQEKNEVIFLDKPNMASILNSYQQSKKRLFFLDYDGTLINLNLDPQAAFPTNEVIELLMGISSDPLNKIVIVSGRDSGTLEKWFGKLPIDMVAEHGAEYKQAGDWQKKTKINSEWLIPIKEIMEEFTAICYHSTIEEKKHTVAWHYRNVEPEIGFVKSRELIAKLNDMLHNRPINVIDGNKVVEVKGIDYDKGKISTEIIAADDYDFVLAIGDDRTDEDMFAVLNNDGHFTIKVGKGSTIAHYSLDTVTQVHSFLQRFIALKYH